MKVLWTRVVTSCATFLVCGACQDVQLDSTPGAPMEQTEVSTGPPLDTKKQVELEVRLGTLDQVRPKVSVRLRNPFRLGGSSSSTPSVQNPALPTGSDERLLAVSSVTETMPGVRLRMIGRVDGPRTGERIAILTDGDVVFYGREGEILDGRYRIVGLGTTWVKVESVDGGDRQTLRLTEP